MTLLYDGIRLIRLDVARYQAVIDGYTIELVRAEEIKPADMRCKYHS